MAKKLTESDKFYIRYHHIQEGMTADEIAKQIGKTMPQVRGYISSLPKREVSEEEAQEVTTNDQTGVLKVNKRNPLFARRERDGKVIATVMTPGASEESDDSRFTNQSNKYIEDAVIKIHDD